MGRADSENLHSTKYLVLKWVKRAQNHTRHSRLLQLAKPVWNNKVQMLFHAKSWEEVAYSLDHKNYSTYSSIKI